MFMLQIHVSLGILTSFELFDCYCKRHSVDCNTVLGGVNIFTHILTQTCELIHNQNLHNKTKEAIVLQMENLSGEVGGGNAQGRPAARSHHNSNQIAVYCCAKPNLRSKGVFFHWSHKDV